MNCPDCIVKDLHITDLKGQMSFYRTEMESWRKAFQEQRGGAAFDKIQKAYSDTVLENVILRNKLKAINANQSG